MGREGENKNKTKSKHQKKNNPLALIGILHPSDSESVRRDGSFLKATKLTIPLNQLLILAPGRCFSLEASDLSADLCLKEIYCLCLRVSNKHNLPLGLPPGRGGCFTFTQRGLSASKSLPFKTADAAFLPTMANGFLSRQHWLPPFEDEGSQNYSRGSISSESHVFFANLTWFYCCCYYYY